MNIVIPMAGKGRRFVEAGFLKPKPFLDVKGKPMILRVLENLSHPGTRFILVVQEEHFLRERSIVKAIERKFDVIFVPIRGLSEGSACTVLYAHRLINNDEPLIIANSDQIVDVGLEEFTRDMFRRSLDASIMTFVDPERNPKWSFVTIDSAGFVSEVREKVPISSLATVGIYLFREGKFFVDSALDMILTQDKVNGEYYTSPSFNYLIQRQKKVGVYNISKTAMHGIGTPADLDKYLLLLDEDHRRLNGQPSMGCRSD